ncbi:type IA DNA topoisomerase [Lutimonas zeaxanthinifaciens]|uniref:type IA DNA topoisomerase n=1 Tax=Lutimonas zeaxanthinifaciens TaxID=3060215 RepID=UPI00265CF28C|nr:type IA DNA topoisomerase [Lutimonas sp. YSD2104]WKK64618.1 DNA topoisomerase 3 [Lutimonas sp. YSD2104]
MKVCIAEKPSVAREIAKVLGANTKHDGYYEGNGYAVTYTFGHLCTLFEPNDYKPYWKRWDLNNLPMLPKKFKIKVNSDPGIQKQFSIIKSLFDKAEVVINCGDAGQEGELIQRWVMMESAYSGKSQRLWISSLTEEAISEGFNNLKAGEEYDNLFFAGYSRAIGDWLLGMNATRLFTLKYGKNSQVLSIGRVQTPTLAMVVKRFSDIKNFKPIPYWELNTTFRDTVFRYEDGRFHSKEEGQIIADKISQKEIEIIDVEKKKGKEYAPKLFDLTGLQVYCNTKFGMTAEQTLSTAQKLYESKVITYPRVDTTFLSNDIYPKVPGILKKLMNYKVLCEPLLQKKIKKSSKVFNDKKVTDHHAIIPTGMEIYLSGDQQKVYDAITRRFIAVFYPDCEVAHTHVKADIQGYIFKTSGKVIVVPGWKEVFNKTDQTGDPEAATLPLFVKGEKGSHKLSFIEKETKPPNQFTEASLLRSMETAGKDIEDEEMRDLMKENGIGRPSTRASIIETLFRRKYIVRNKKQILPTKMGMDLIATIQNELLKSAELTGSWERKLKEIERGEYPAGSFIRQMKSMVDQLVYEVRSDVSPRSISMEVDLPDYKNSSKKPKASTILGAICPKCEKGVMVKGTKAYGCSNFKSGCDFILPFRFKKKKISEKQYLRLLDKNETVHLKGFQESERKINGKIVLNDDFQLELLEKNGNLSKEETNIRSCPKCAQGKIVRGKSAYGCSNYNKGCDFVFPFEKLRKLAKGQKLNEETALKIMSET